MKRVTTLPNHGQANLVERANRTFKTMIATFVKSDHHDWDAHIHEFRHALNTAVQSSTKVSPAFLNYGWHPQPVKSLRRETDDPRVVERIEPAVWLDRVRRLDALCDLVAQFIDEARERQAKYYNKREEERDLSSMG